MEMSKSIEQLHSIRWSDTANCLTLLRRFPVTVLPLISARPQISAAPLGIFIEISTFLLISAVQRLLE